MHEESEKTATPKEKTCCVAGHRDIPGDKAEAVKAALEREVRKAVADGYTCFLTDLMEGTDQLFADVMVQMRRENQDIRLEAVLPYRSQRDKLLADEKTMPLLLACTDTSYTGEKYAPGCYTANRREQLKRSSRIIVVFDGREDGGTIKAIRMAHAQSVAVREIPLGL